MMKATWLGRGLPHGDTGLHEGEQEGVERDIWR
jgi:hypothetical protein